MSVKTISSEYISRHQYFTARKDSYQTDTGKIVDPYFVVELPMAAGVMAITENNEVVLVKQYRHPVGESMLELPGGFIEAGEDPELAIRRELLEETGYDFSNIDYVFITFRVFIKDIYPKTIWYICIYLFYKIYSRFTQNQTTI